MKLKHIILVLSTFVFLSAIPVYIVALLVSFVSYDFSLLNPVNWSPPMRFLAGAWTIFVGYVHIECAIEHDWSE